MRMPSRSHVSAAAVGAAVALIVGSVVYSGSGEAAPRHMKAKINATTLNGYHANQLVKATSIQDPNAIDNFDTCTFTTTQTLKTVVPGKGYLMVWGSVGSARDTDFPNPAVLRARLKLGVKKSAEHATTLTQDGGFSGNVSVQALFPVVKGPRTLELQLSECESAAAAFVTDQTIS
ncbi:MAG: hypothetical protein WAK18_14895, partial [Nocardioidaceae bacterium]